ncbi:hypothetical protein GCM10009821_03360 [Aeromicrobium halocynthiae]|uniref:Prepilin type IV endopeptidase peptidase domain-containing protein n=1 Tax=Aeromicrobium halocynthiae TaxID=560557 RepID=A0ABN2VR10_9ACTN
MSTEVVVALAAVVAGLAGAAGPAVVRRLPEPVPHPDEEATKVHYADMGSGRTSVLLAVLAAALTVSIAGLLPSPSLLGVWVALAGVGSWLAWVDWRTRLLPFRLTAPLHVAVLALTALAAVVERDAGLLWAGLLANVLVFVLFWVLWFVGARVGSTFGYGDVRLAGILALALGPLGYTATAAGIYAGFLLGAVGGIALSALGIVDRKGFAFGPYMVVGAFVGPLVVSLW